jgi:hypothetical protein
LRPELAKTGELRRTPLPKESYCITRVTVVEWLKLPLVPVMVSVAVPIGVLRFVVMVSVLDPDPVIELGLKVAVARDGSPLTLRPTVPVNPFSAPTVTAYMVLDPRVTVCEAGDAAMLKSGATPCWLIQIGADHISSPELSVT